MHKLLARINDPEQREQGFTLIELLVVIIIIGILSAIAIPIFLNQKKKAADATAKSDVRNAVSVIESTFTDNNGQVIGGAAINKVSGPTKFTLKDNAATPAAISGADVVVSNGNSFNAAGSSAAYCVAAKASNGTTTYWYDSTTGAVTATSTQPTTGSCVVANITAP